MHAHVAKTGLVAYEARRDGGNSARSTSAGAQSVCGLHAGSDGYFAVGMANSGPFMVLSGQRCMIDFCRV
jgi:hypothetical protein